MKLTGSSTMPACFLAFIACIVLETGASPCQQMRCFADPCVGSTCPAHATEAVCVQDYCGGCKAKWMLNGADVTETCQKSIKVESASTYDTALTEIKAPPLKKAELPPPSNNGNVDSLPRADSKPPCRARCLADPCSVTTCPVHQSEALCSPNYCGGCHSRWTMNGVDVTEACIKSFRAERLSRLKGVTIHRGTSRNTKGDNSTPKRRRPFSGRRPRYSFQFPAWWSRF